MRNTFKFIDLARCVSLQCSDVTHASLIVLTKLHLEQILEVH